MKKGAIDTATMRYLGSYQLFADEDTRMVIMRHFGPGDPAAYERSDPMIETDLVKGMNEEGSPELDKFLAGGDRLGQPLVTPPADEATPDPA